MGAYLARRLLLALVTVWLVTVVIFLLLRVAPGDAVVAAIAQAPGEGTLTAEQIDARREALGLNRPYAVQYFDHEAEHTELEAEKWATVVQFWGEKDVHIINWDASQFMSDLLEACRRPLAAKESA